MDGGIHIVLKAEPIAHLLGVPITNAMIMTWVTMLTLIILGVAIGGRLKKIPGKVQTLVETLFGFLIDYTEEVLESRPLALKFFPLLATLFVFILCANWFEFLPGIGPIHLAPPAATAATEVARDPLFDQADPAPSAASVAESGVELLHPVTTDLNVTLALAIISFLVIEVSGVMFVGFFKYAGKFLNFRSVMGFFVGIIELVSELARLISFSFRLFGNMFAGDVLILVAMYFVPFVLPVPVMLYEVLVGFIQASIFALLTLFFIKLAVSEAH
jgi:F-type H+-transporting ATPase subunit a